MGLGIIGSVDKLADPGFLYGIFCRCSKVGFKLLVLVVGITLDVGL